MSLMELDWAARGIGLICVAVGLTAYYIFRFGIGDFGSFRVILAIMVMVFLLGLFYLISAKKNREERLNKVKA